MKYYTGIGSRETPADVLALMELVAAKLSRQGLTLRSGHAAGADRAFECGANGDAVIYQPWPGFGEKRYGADPGMPVLGTPVVDRSQWLRNFEALAEMGVTGRGVPESVCLLHGRNVAQVVGHDAEVTPSKFVIGWAKINADGSVSGGTRVAFRYASHIGVPVFNLADAGTRSRLEAFVA
jgi:hypothetical protein